MESLDSDAVDAALRYEPPPELLDAVKLAALLSISPRTLYRLKLRGHLPPPIRLGGSIRWRLSDIERWIAAGCPKPEESHDVDRATGS